MQPLLPLPASCQHNFYSGSRPPDAKLCDRIQRSAHDFWKNKFKLPTHLCLSKIYYDSLLCSKHVHCYSSKWILVHLFWETPSAQMILGMWRLGLFGRLYGGVLWENLERESTKSRRRETPRCLFAIPHAQFQSALFCKTVAYRRTYGNTNDTPQLLNHCSLYNFSP